MFVALHGLDPATVADAVPPSVRRVIEPASSPRREGTDLVLELGPWHPRAPACHVVPAMSLLSGGDSSIRFELSARRGGTWSPWVASATLGAHEFVPLPAAADGLVVDIDEMRATPPVDAVRLRVRVAGATAGLDGPWLVSLSCWDGAAAPRGGRVPTAIRLDVPARTQHAEPEAVRMRVCSPTSLGMAMEYLGCSVPTARLAEAVFHPSTDRYGVWPAAVRAAAAHGVPGYLLRFPDGETAGWCLERGLPIVASIRFSAGALANAPLRETDGHLVVITGWEGDEVLVNDPAAPTVDAVPRRYRQDEFARAWLDGAGIGYVFFRA